MTRKNKKKEQWTEEKSKFPSKDKLGKHLNADALFMSIRREFEKMPEFRTGDNKISILDALMSTFAMFSLKDPSSLKVDERRKEKAESQNLKSIYGIKYIPSDSRIREICDKIDPKKYLSPIFKVPFRHLQRGKLLEQMVFYKGHYLLNLDSTGFFSSKKVSTPYCTKFKNVKEDRVGWIL